jgi:PadR family transcriptional regulator PadR
MLCCRLPRGPGVSSPAVFGALMRSRATMTPRVAHSRGAGAPMKSSGRHVGSGECKPMSKPTDLVQGTLDLLILRVIGLEPMHGWAVAQRIRQMSNEELRVGQGSLYPALHKLEQGGLIAAEWAVSDNNRRAKYYRLTSAGRKALRHETAQWERLSMAISLVVRPV